VTLLISHFSRIALSQQNIKDPNEKNLTLLDLESYVYIIHLEMEQKKGH